MSAITFIAVLSSVLRRPCSFGHLGSIPVESSFSLPFEKVIADIFHKGLTVKMFMSQLMLSRNFPKNNINIPLLEVPLSDDNQYVKLTETEWGGFSRGRPHALPARPTGSDGLDLPGT